MLGAIIGDIARSIAEAIWPIPDEMKQQALAYLTDGMKKVYTSLFYYKRGV